MPTPTLKLVEGKYHALWSDNRRSKRKSMGTADRATAEARFAQWLLIGGHHTELSPAVKKAVTVADLWKVYWVKHVERESAAPDAIGYAWKNLEPHFGKLHLSEVTHAVVEAYVEKRVAGRASRAAKPATVRKELAALTAAFNFCAGPKSGIIGKAEVPFIALPDEGEPRDRWLRMDEIKKLFAAASSLRRGDRLSRCERFLWIALETAARLQAILDLTWDRVDFHTRTIHFDVPGRKKTKKRRPSVSISTTLLPILQRAYEERTGELVLDTKADVWASIQTAARAAGFGGEKPLDGAKPKATGISPHVLRHTAATHMARNGVPLWVVAKVLGNSLAMAEKVYAKWTPDNPEGTVDMISKGALVPDPGTKNGLQ